MVRMCKALTAAFITFTVGGCGTLIEGEHARLDHWGPLPVVCLGECSALDPYYYDKQPAAQARTNMENTAGAPAPTAQPEDQAVRRQAPAANTSPTPTAIP